MKTQKFIFTTAIFLLSTLYASAYDFTVDGMYYNFIRGTDNVEVTYDGWPSTYEGDIVIPETVSWEGKVYQVTEIGYSAFNNAAITSCQIPNTITKIASGAFLGADLSNITIPASVIEMETGFFGGNKKYILFSSFCQYLFSFFLFFFISFGIGTDTLSTAPRKFVTS